MTEAGCDAIYHAISRAENELTKPDDGLLAAMMITNLVIEDYGYISGEFVRDNGDLDGFMYLPEGEFEPNYTSSSLKNEELDAIARWMNKHVRTVFVGLDGEVEGQIFELEV
jgi:hypothetical protein